MKNTFDIKVVLGQNVRHLRDASGLTQQELADKADVESGGYISRVENGKKWPRPDILATIAKSLKVEVKDLFDQKSSKANSKENVAYEKWANKFGTIFKKMKEADIQHLYDYVKRTYRK